MSSSISLKDLPLLTTILETLEQHFPSEDSQWEMTYWNQEDWKAEVVCGDSYIIAKRDGWTIAGKYQVSTHGLTSGWHGSLDDAALAYKMLLKNRQEAS